MLLRGSAPKPRETSVLWLLKMAGGVLIILLLALHFVINHLVVPGGLLTYQDVVNYYKTPIVPIIEGFFLVFVVGHALLGVRSILLDLSLSLSVQKWLDRLMLLLGTAAIVYGIWLLVVMAQR
jgi:succinate dehydrogenase hydrophobic anchor subunit